MEHAHIAVPCVDGSVTLLCVILNDDRGLSRSLTPMVIESEIAKSSTPRVGKDGVAYVGWPSPPVVAENGHYAWRSIVMDQDTKAKFDSPYRDALKDFGFKIDHDMERARSIHREILRRDRAPLLASLDVSFMQAQETADTALSTDVVATKQVLRDITDDPRIDAATTVEELAAITVETVLAETAKVSGVATTLLAVPEK